MKRQRRWLPESFGAARTTLDETSAPARCHSEGARAAPAVPRHHPATEQSSRRGQVTRPRSRNPALRGAAGSMLVQDPGRRPKDLPSRTRPPRTRFFPGITVPPPRHRRLARAAFYRSRSGGCSAPANFRARGHDPASPKKPRSRPLAGSRLATKDLWHPADRLRSASGRRVRIHPALPTSPRGSGGRCEPRRAEGALAGGRNTRSRPGSRHPLRGCLKIRLRDGRRDWLPEGAHAGNLNVHRSLRATEGSTAHGTESAHAPVPCTARKILRSAPWIQSKQGFRRRLPQEVKRGETFLNTL
jgi:hypothetical protein